MFSSWTRRIMALGILGVLAVVGLGVWYLYFRDEPEHLKLAQPDAVASVTATKPAGTTTAAATGAASSATAAASVAPVSVPAGTTAFKVDAAKSQAAYFAGEKLASLPTNSVAKGTTTQISGDFFLTADGLSTAAPSKFTVDLKNLKSDSNMRDNRVQQTLQTAQFPSATFTVTKLTGFPAQLPTTGTGAAFQMSGTLEVHGVKKDVVWDVTALRSGATFSALAKINVKYADFGMSGPSIGGFVSVDDNLSLEIQIVATAAN